MFSVLFADGATKPVQIDYLFTTFPNLSETFYQREIRALHQLGESPVLYSLWGGEPTFDGHHVEQFRKCTLLSLVWWIPYWLALRPRVMFRLVGRLLGTPPPALLNLAETLLGLGFALTHAHRFRRNDPERQVIHAAWATAPGTAAQLIAALTGRRFCLGAHAYDVFRNGGDWWLDSKLADAKAIVTSTESTRAALLQRGASETSTYLIRRGLNELAPLKPLRTERSPLRLLSVGRLIEKKGYFAQLKLYRALVDSGLQFEARVIGGGPLLAELTAAIDEFDLGGHVTLVGPLAFAQTTNQYAWADVFVFMGIVANSGDRDGLPNVVPEAMAAGLPVVSTPVGGVPEAIEHTRSGLLLDVNDTNAWMEALTRLSHDDDHYCDLRGNARGWVEREFDATRNASKLLEVWRSVSGAD